MRNAYSSKRRFIVFLIAFIAVTFIHNLASAWCAVPPTLGPPTVTGIPPDGWITQPASGTMQATFSIPGQGDCQGYYFYKIKALQNPAIETLVSSFDGPIVNLNDTPPIWDWSIPDLFAYPTVGSFIFETRYCLINDPNPCDDYGAGPDQNFIQVYGFAMKLDAPINGASIDGCDTPASGTVSVGTNVSLDLDGDISYATVYFANSAVPGTFSSNISLPSGDHILTASYAGHVGATVNFSSLCKTLNFKGPTAGDDLKALIHNSGSSKYSSTYQDSLQPAGDPPGTADGRIKIEFSVNEDSATGKAIGGQLVYFRVIDPADASPYNAGAPDDNGGGDKTTTPKRPATLGETGVNESDTNPGVWTATSGTDGIVQVILQIPGSVPNPESPTNVAAKGGDNYQIEASFDPNFPSGSTVSSSIIRAWKRVYLEQDNMFKKGALLYATYDKDACGSACNQIQVYSWGQTVTNFQIKQNDLIAFFDDSYTSGDPTLDPITEKRKVTKVSIPTGSSVATITFKNPSSGQQDKLAKTYEAANRDVDSGMPKFTIGHSAAVGVVGSDFYALPSPSASTFDQAYVEVLSNSSESGVLPFVPQPFFQSCNFFWLNFHQAWFKNKKPAPCTITCGTEFSGMCQNTPQNYFHLMGISAGLSTATGIAHPTSDDSFVYSDAIYLDVYGSPGVTKLCTGNPSTCTKEFNNYLLNVVNHEITHQFNVNTAGIPPCDPIGNHDGNRAWCGNPGTTGTQASCIPSITDNKNCLNMTEEWCLMNRKATVPDYYCQAIDGIDQLDCSDLKGGTCLGVVQDCAGTPPQSIRTISDPQ